jgi:hypothetical protein
LQLWVLILQTIETDILFPIESALTQDNTQPAIDCRQGQRKTPAGKALDQTDGD